MRGALHFAPMDTKKTILVLLLLAAPAAARGQDMDMPMDGACHANPVVDDGAVSLTRALADVAPCDTKMPTKVMKYLASKPMREHHYLWHLVRTNWSQIPAATKSKLVKQGWTPPRAQGDAGSGADFLCMHHQMIQEVDAQLQSANVACYKSIEGWNPIPWDPNDPKWPMPSAMGADDSAKDPAETKRNEDLVDSKYSQDAWLKDVKTLDDLGREFETGIHGWMHMHWATEHGPKNAMACGDTNAKGCDWLGTPYTAHVNPVFWKLHGWIEERAQRWAELHKVDLDKACDGAFAGPAGMKSMPGMMGAHEGMTDPDFQDVVNGLPKNLKPANLKF